MRRLILLASSLLPVLALASPLEEARRSDLTFDPSAFSFQQATCPGINRAENKTVDLHLRMPPTTVFPHPLIRFLLGRIS